MVQKYDLEDRFIRYCITINSVTEKFEISNLGIYIGKQLIRSGTSPALNYGEAQSAESRKDFIHKMKIILKELKESRISLKIAEKKPLIKDKSVLITALKETEELISIVYKSVETAKRNQ